MASDIKINWFAIALYIFGSILLLLWASVEIDSGEAMTRRTILENDEPFAFWVAVFVKLILSFIGFFKAVILSAKKLKK